jgi:NADPH:quinone reductase-like Zn-dependent oxidoreductase
MIHSISSTLRFCPPQQVLKRYASVIVDSTGNPLSVMRFDSAAVMSREPSDREVKIGMKTSLILPRDISAIRGERLVSITSSLLGGYTGVGVVTSTGSNSSALKPNDVVLVNGDGCWANEITTFEENVSKIGDLPFDEAAILPSYLSAWAILNLFEVLQVGCDILQLDGDSAVGLALTEVGKAYGLNMISVSSKEVEDASFLQKWKGRVTFAVAGSTQSARTFSKSLSPGAKLVFHTAKYTPTSMASTIDFPISMAIFQNVTVSGFDYASWVGSSPDSFRAALVDILKLIAEKKLSPKLATFPIVDYQNAIFQTATTRNASVLKF